MHSTAQHSTGLHLKLLFSHLLLNHEVRAWSVCNESLQWKFVGASSTVHVILHLLHTWVIVVDVVFFTYLFDDKPFSSFTRLYEDQNFLASHFVRFVVQ